MPDQNNDAFSESVVMKTFMASSVQAPGSFQERIKLSTTPEDEQEDTIHHGYPHRTFVRFMMTFQGMDIRWDLISKWLDWNHIQAKQIHASQDILDTYHDAYLYGRLSTAARARTVLRIGWISYLITALEFLASTVSSSLYIASTFDSEAFKLPDRLFFGFLNAFFVVDYAFKLLSARVRLEYALSWNGTLDLATSVPCALYFTGWISFYSNVSRAIIFIRVARSLMQFIRSGVITSSIMQEILQLVVYLLAIVSVAAGVLQWVDAAVLSTSLLEEYDCSRNGCVNYFEALYWVLVTISTVGYGDYFPYSDVGRLMIIILIFTTFIVVPVQINNIWELASKRPYGQAPFSNRFIGSRYIILCGTVTHRQVIDFLYTFFHPVHDADIHMYPIRIVVMAPFKPSFELKSLVALYNGSVHFVEGSPINWNDLDRVQAKQASAIFVLGNSHPEDAESEDSSKFVQALSINRYCGRSTRVIVEVANPDSENSAVWDDTGDSVEVFCPQYLRFKLLAASVYIHGVTTFLGNLFRPALKLSLPVENHFMHEYYKGHLQEVYPVIFPPALHGLLFQEVAHFLFLHLGVVLFALDIQSGDSVDKHSGGQVSRRVYLFPQGHIISHSDVGLVIAGNLRIAEKVSRIGKSQGWRHGDASHSLLEQVRGQWEDSSLHSRRHLHIQQDQDQDHDPMRCQEERKRVFKVKGVDRAFWNASVKVSSEKKALLPEGGQQKDDEVETLASLEDAVERLLTWPPKVVTERPHPAVLSWCRVKILDNLRDRTLPVAHLSESHVLVCMESALWPYNLFHFVLHLRSDFSASHPIVILSATEPTAEEWGCLGMFQNVFYVKGSPLFEVDLMRAGVLRAVKVLVLMAEGWTRGEVSASVAEGRLSFKSGDYAGDVNNIIVAANVERLRGTGDNLLVELRHEQTFQYMRPKWLLQRHRLNKDTYRKNTNAVYQFCPPFQSGNAFCPYSLSFLTFSTFYNRNSWNIVEQLLCGGETEDELPRSQGQGSSCRLWQVPLPQELVGKTYEKVFLHFLQTMKMLALGLYRCAGTMSSVSPYVHTNPASDLIVAKEDSVFVIVSSNQD